MRINQLKDVYDKIDTSKDMDKRIIENVTNSTSSKFKNHKTIKKYVALVSCLVILVSISTELLVSNAETDKFYKTFKNSYSYVGGKVDLEGEYKDINDKTTSLKDGKCTLEEIENMLGIKILKSDKSFEPNKNKFFYNPHSDDDGNIYGAFLSNDFYCVGDAKVKQTKYFKEWDTCNSIEYECGKEFKSPIWMQVYIRTDKTKDKNITDHEIEYDGNESKLLNGEFMMRTYNISNLNDTPALMHKCRTDGLESCQCAKRRHYDDCVITYSNIIFIYDNVEYHFGGAVSYDTLKDFVEGLHY